MLQVASDTEIQQAVLSELKRDGRVEATDVGVEVDRGVVTLTGTVSSGARRVAAQEAAHRAAGVLDVANDIRVRLPSMLGRTDTEVALAVRRALEWHTRVPADRIASTVTDGIVTLEGIVDSWYQREDAERALRAVAGVRGIVNHLVIGLETVEAQRVREAIATALGRRAERAVSKIEIWVEDDSVRLHGPVHSWHERRAVLGAARYTPGVRKVIDELYFDPDV